jgi:hypothetical protein
VRETAPPPPPGLRLVPLPGQGDRVEMEGVLKRAGWAPGQPTRFRLLQPSDSQTRTVCLVLGNEKQLMSFRDRRLRIIGRQYWVQDQRYPVLVPEKIIPRRTSAR